MAVSAKETAEKSTKIRRRVNKDHIAASIGRNVIASNSSKGLNEKAKTKQKLRQPDNQCEDESSDCEVQCKWADALSKKSTDTYSGKIAGPNGRSKAKRNASDIANITIATSKSSQRDGSSSSTMRQCKSQNVEDLGSDDDFKPKKSTRTRRK